jgi:transposase
MELYYVPFYRYLKFDEKIGFRAWYKTLVNEPTNVLQHQGYYPLGHNPNANMKNNIENLKPLRNRYFEEIKQICKSYNINLITVTTPMCKNVKGMDYFKKVKAMYPEIKEYEQCRKNYIEHISGPKILQTFRVRNKTLLELVQLMAHEEQYITLGGKATTIHSHSGPMINNWVNTTESVIPHKNKEVPNAKTEEENINTFIQFFEPHYNDKELEELLKTEPNIVYEKDTELEQILIDNPMKYIYRKHSPQTHTNTIAYNESKNNKKK